MKKLLSVIMCFCILSSAFALSGITASAQKSGDYIYKLKKDGTVSISSYTGKSRNIIIPEKFGGKTVTSIEAWFPDNVVSVVLPDTVTSISSDTFSYCYSLESVDLGDGITKIPDSAFSYSERLKTVVLPKNLKSIGDNAFSECGALKIDNPIPNGVTNIGYGAFYKCYSMYNFTIPDSVKAIGGAAFELTGYANTKDNWDNGLLYIDNCLVGTKVNVGSTVNVEEGTRIIADYAFQDTNVINIKVPDSVTYIGNGAFAYCEKLKSISLSKNIKNIKSYLFSGCKRLTSVTLPDGIAKIGLCAFSDCVKLNSINLPDSLEQIEYGVFLNCKQIKLALPKKLKKIGEYAFKNCGAFTSFKIPASVTSIGDGAFNNCDSLKKITVDKNNAVYSSKDGVLYNKDKSQLITYPVAKKGKTYKVLNSVKTINSAAFEQCKNLKTVKLSKNINELNANVFIGGSVKNIEVDKNNKTFSSEDGVLYNKNKTKLIRYLDGGTVKNYTVKTGVKTIGKNAFSECYKLQKIVLPDTVIKIGSEAFSWSYNIKSIVIPASVKKIADSTLWNLEYTDCIIYVEKGSAAHKCVKEFWGINYSFEKLKVEKPEFSLQAQKRGFKVKYEAPDNTKGFKVQFKLKDGKWKTKVFRTNESVVKAVSNLKKGKTYYVRVCSYAKSGNTKYFSKWTNVKTVKVK